MGRVTRVAGLLALGVRRVVGGRSKRTTLSVLGVALAVGLMLVVTGTSLGLATQNSVYGSGVDYWIVPESASASTLPVSVGNAHLGDAHTTSERIARFEGVRRAVPVGISVLNLSSGGSSAYVLVAGVVAHPDVAVSGVDVGALEPGDPHYANGTYDGQWTNEIVLSTGAAELLNASAGSDVTVPGGRNMNASHEQFRVVATQNASASTGVGSFPIGIVHLSELQALTGGTANDQATRILVQTNDPGVESELETVYPRASVVPGSSSSFQEISQTELALAIGLTAFLVAIVVGTLFVATAMGLEVAADRRQFATLAAIGLPWRSRMLVLAAQTVTVAAIGGVLGVLLGIGGISLANTVAASVVGTDGIAVFRPSLAGYGLAVAIGIGLLTVPYLVWLLGRSSVLEQLST